MGCLDTEWMRLSYESDYSEPNDTFMDVFEAVHTAPEDLPALWLDYGFMARVRDGRRIRGDFHRAIENLGLRKEPAAP